MSDRDAALGDRQSALEIADADQEDAQTGEQMQLMPQVAQFVGQSQPVFDGFPHFIAVAAGEHCRDGQACL